MAALHAGLVASNTQAADLPEGFAEVRLAQGLDPTGLAIAPDGRLFLTEKAGRIRVVKNDVLLPTPFATVVPETSNEQGLLGITLDPAFAQNGYVYVYYTVPGPNGVRHNRLSRFRAAGDVASGGETALLELDPRQGGIHNGGALAFGPDGKLYVSVGDDSSNSNPQSMSTLHGKILRLNADGTIPGDNPNGALPYPNNAIWALGLRNPFQMAFQPGTGVLYINDVGGSAWEEINQGAPNANYGWPQIEGRRGGATPPPNYRDPVYAYSHAEGCSITGGVFYNPTTASFTTSYVGKYLFADYCHGMIKTLDPKSGAVATFASEINRPLVFQVAADGSLYYIARGGLGSGSLEDNTRSANGELYRVRYTASLAPSISAQPESQIVSPGETARFIVGASGAAPLAYQWQRNGTNIAGATAASYTTPVAALTDDGAKYRVVVSNAQGSVTSAEVTLTVALNAAPTPSIDLPFLGTLYAAGNTIGFSGRATDPEDGAIPASGLTWWIDFHHDEHTHPALDPLPGVASGSYTIPRNAERAHNVFYRIYLRATDSRGRQATTSRDLLPRKSTFTLSTEPTGLGLLLDGQPIDTPLRVTGVVGVTRTLEAPATQTLGGKAYAFLGWSDGGAATHDIQTPTAATSYVARYEESTIGSGTGLRGAYYAGTTLGGTPLLTRTEAVDFAWGIDAPAPGSVPADDFSVRWTGEVEAPISGSYIFSTVSDDGIRLSVDGKLLIDRWTDHAPTVDTAPAITLAAGKRYPIVLEFYEKGGLAEARLRWTYPGVATSPVPAARLYAGNAVMAAYKVNFQPDYVPIPTGYRADTGAVFGPRGDGLRYGWSADLSADVRDRDAHPDQRYDTLIHLQKSGSRSWEIEVPNGTYTYQIVAGDPSNVNQVNALMLESTRLPDPDGEDAFDEYRGTVTVLDGRLTLSPASDAVNAKLCFIDLTPTPE